MKSRFLRTYMVEALRIQKRVVAAKVRAVGQTLQGDLYLAEHAERHSGLETVLDLLVGEDPFFPLVQKGKVTMVPVASVDWVAVSSETDAHYMVPGLAEEARGVRLTFETGGELSGLLMAQFQPDDHRLLDGLNEQHPFVPVLVGQETLMVNSRRALWSEPPSRPTLVTSKPAPKKVVKKKKPVAKKRR